MGEKMTEVIRKAFVMQLDEGKVDEYIKRHDEIWPEMLALLKAKGGQNYSIFFHPQTHQLFGYVEVKDEATWAEVSQSEVCQKWWKYMGDIMQTNPDMSPQSIDLKPTFYMT